MTMIAPAHLEKPRAGRYTGTVPQTDARQFAIEMARIAHDHKAEDIVALDLQGISSITDFTVICTGTSDRQMRALAERVIEYGRKIGERPYGISGRESATWVLLDYVDAVLHVFSKQHRSYYDLELLWGDAPRIDWARSESA